MTATRVLVIIKNHDAAMVPRDIKAQTHLAIDVESNEAAALGRAWNRAYDVILLECESPALNSWRFVAALRAAGIATPVIVLSASCSAIEQAAALEAGATAYHPRPLTADAWHYLLCKLLPNSYRDSYPAEKRCDMEQAGRLLPWAAHGLERLQRLRDAHANGMVDADEIRSWALVTVLCSSSIPHCLAGAAVFKIVARDFPQVTCSTLEASCQLYRQAGRVRFAARATIQRAISRFEAGNGDALRVRERSLASDYGVDGAHFGRLLYLDTGLRFRDWRLGARLRVALPRLAGSDQVSQIAFSSGWTSVARFECHFRNVLGLSPRTFRAIAKFTSAVRKN